MAGCILHFGMHKTGSSSIQESLARNLEDPRFHYCSLDDSGSDNASGPLLRAFLKNPESHPVLPQRARSGNVERDRTRIIDRLRTGLERSRTQTVILSAEGLCHLDADECGRLVSVIREYTPEISAVAYVRSPRSYMQSAFQQRLSHLTRDPPSLQRLYPGYASRFTNLIGAVGRDNVRFWPFDPATFEGGCVVQDFCARLGIRMDPDRIVRRNESMSLAATQLLYAYRATGTGQKPDRGEVARYRRIVDGVRTIGGPRLEFHPDLVADIIAENAEDVAWMERVMGVSLREAERPRSPEAIRTEPDLLRFSEEALAWVREKHPGATAMEHGNPSPRQVGACLEAIGYGSLSSLGVPPPEGWQLGPPTPEFALIDARDLVRSLSERGRTPPGVSAADCERLVRRALRDLSNRLWREERAVRVSQLGRFEPAGGSWYFAPETDEEG